MDIVVFNLLLKEQGLKVNQKKFVVLWAWLKKAQNIFVNHDYIVRIKVTLVR